VTTAERRKTLHRMAATDQGIARPSTVERSEAEMEELVESGHVTRIPNSSIALYQLTSEGKREAWLSDPGMSTAKHLTAVEEAIRRAGGPENVRFAAVSIELVRATQPVGPLEVAVSENADTGLVDITFTEIKE